MKDTAFYRFLCAHRPLCVLYETLRWLGHNIFFFVRTRTPVWYRFDRKYQAGEQPRETLPLDAAWYRISRPLYRHEHVYYNFDAALAANPSVKGLALIFFMGIGDY